MFSKIIIIVHKALTATCKSCKMTRFEIETRDMPTSFNLSKNPRGIKKRQTLVAIVVNIHVTCGHEYFVNVNRYVSMLQYVVNKGA